MPGIENYAANILNQAHTEVMSIFPLVTEANREKYLEFVSANYQQWVLEGHMVSTICNIERGCGVLKYCLPHNLSLFPLSA